MKNLYFKYTTDIENLTEILDKPLTTNLSLLGNVPEEQEEEFVEQPECNYEQEPEGKYEQEPPDDYDDNVDRIINTIKTALEHIAETYYKVEYDNMIAVPIVNRKRILKIDIDYIIENTFLNITLLTGKLADQYKKDKNVFDYTYDGGKYVYFVWYSTFGSHQSTGKYFIDLKKYILNEVVSKRKEQASIYATKAQKSAVNAQILAKRAQITEQGKADLYLEQFGKIYNEGLPKDEQIKLPIKKSKNQTPLQTNTKKKTRINRKSKGNTP
jgi:hypothetical protein